MALVLAFGAASLLAGLVAVRGADVSFPSISTSTEVLGLSALSNGPQTSVTEAPPPVTLPGENHAGKAAYLLARMNDVRSEAGRSALSPDDDLASVALSRARDLVTKDYFEHYGPAGENAFDELRARGIVYGVAGENLARNNRPANTSVEHAFRALMASETHRANILEARYSRVGTAAVQSGRMWIYVIIFAD